MRRNIVAGNWKMNNTFEDAIELISEINEIMVSDDTINAEVILCPPAIFMELATDIAEEEETFKIGIQNISHEKSGAFTGEISAEMVASMDIGYCIIGHSERRKYFNESNEMLAKKTKLAIENEIQPIFCCGEVLEEREAKNHFEVVAKQLEKGLFHLNKDEILEAIIAYEPVWAIGTGKTATPEQAQEMHAHIRTLLLSAYGPEVANDVSILYGGSCNAANAKTLFSQPDVDGGLIGGASLKAEDFITIAKSF